MKEKGPFKVLDSRKIYSNLWLTLREDRVIRPGGTKGIFGVIEMKAGSTVLALDDNNKVYLTKEYKYGIGRESIELMSGGLDENETPLDAAKRELKEELGLIAEEWTYMGVVDPFTTIVNSSNHMFLARKLQKVQQNLDAGEELEILRVSFPKAIDMVLSGEITHSASCVLILKADKHLKNNIHKA